LIRLACQAQTYGAVSIVIPPWNGVFGKYLKNEKEQLERSLESPSIDSEEDPASPANDRYN